MKKRLLRTFTSAMPQTGFNWPVCGIFLLIMILSAGFPISGMTQTCLHFAGKQRVAAKVELAPGLKDFTIEARFKTQNPADGSLYRLFSWDVGSQSRIEVGVMDGLLSVFHHSETAAEGLVNSEAMVTDNQWHHVAYIRTDNKVEVLLDGKVVLTEISQTLPGKDFFIGSWYERDSDWNGCIDEVRIWSVARTAKEIADFQHKAIPKRLYAKMLAYFPCNEGKANSDNRKIQTLKDYSGHTLGRLDQFEMLGSTSNFIGENQTITPPPPPTEEDELVVAAQEYEAPPPPPVDPNHCLVPAAVVQSVFGGAPITGDFNTLKDFFLRSGMFYNGSVQQSFSTSFRDTFWIVQGAQFGNYTLGKEKSFVVVYNEEDYAGVRQVKHLEAWLAMNTHEIAERLSVEKLALMTSIFSTSARYLQADQVHRHMYIIEEGGQRCYQLALFYSTVQHAAQFIKLSFSQSK
ncbi:MAG: LamG domain-containing protein [Chitinophagales bacterium]|nr:LamG domain-containing protein [Chitinophagales bacterium]